MFFFSGSGCSTAFIRVYAALGLATNLSTIESRTLQKALAEHLKSKIPLNESFKEAIAKQTLPEDHFLLTN